MRGTLLVGAGAGGGGGPCSKEYSIWGFMLGSPYLGKLPDQLQSIFPI